jgi:pentatricopeptide repeat protein
MQGSKVLYEDEIIVGAVSGTGQLIGEWDYLRKIKDPSLCHTTSVSADVPSIVVAVPLSGVNSLLKVSMAYISGGGGEFPQQLDRFEKERLEQIDVMSKKMSELTKSMTEFEIQFLVDVCGSKSYSAGEELHNKPEYVEAVAAVILQGQVQISNVYDALLAGVGVDSLETAPSTPLRQRPPSQTASSKLTCTSPLIRTSSSKSKPEQPVIMVEGEVLQEYMREASSKTSMSTSQVLKAHTKVKILYVNYEDIRPVFSTSFALRRYAEESDITNQDDFPKAGDVSFVSRYSLLRIPPPEPLTRFPWWHNQERRLLNLALAKRHGRDDWRSDLDEKELGERDETGTHGSTPKDATGATAPSYWNKTTLPTATRDYRIHDNSLSDMEVSILFTTVIEAHTCVKELDALFYNKFSSAKLAGQSADYQALLSDFIAQVRACGSDYLAAEKVERDFQKQGVFADAAISREFVKIYNKSKPVQVDKGAAKLHELLQSAIAGVDSELQHLLCETTHLWCSLGYVQSAEELVSACLEAGMDLPRPVYTSVVVGWIRYRNLEKTTSALCKMIDKDVRPDIVTMNLVLTLYISVGFVEDACQILEEIESAVSGGGERPTKATYVIVISGMLRGGDGERVESMVRRMLRQTGEAADALCLNLVVETWCIAGKMKDAQRALERMQSDLGCPPDEETYALLAAGWAQSGKLRVASDLLLSIASQGYDSSKMDLNTITYDWHSKKWRQLKGFEMTLPSIRKQKLTVREEPRSSPQVGKTRVQPVLAGVTSPAKLAPLQNSPGSRPRTAPEASRPSSRDSHRPPRLQS